MKNPDSYNRGGFLALLGSVVFSLGFFAFIIYGNKGIDLKEVPEAAPEQTLAADKPAADADISKVAKLWESSPELVSHGKAVFQTNCAVCHGAEGKGDGPAGAGLNPPPRNMVEGKWKKGGDSVGLFSVLQHGIEGSSMASFKHLPKADRWALVHFVRSITNNKVPDDAAKLEKFAQTAE